MHALRLCIKYMHEKKAGLLFKTVAETSRKIVFVFLIQYKITSKKNVLDVIKDLSQSIRKIENQGLT